MEYLDERDLNVYIDGSSLSSPRRGGVGILFITEGPDGHWLETPYAVRGPLDARKIRRKTTTEKLQRGSVEMLGQQMTIRLFEEVDASDQGLVRFK